MISEYSFKRKKLHLGEINFDFEEVILRYTKIDSSNQRIYFKNFVKSGIPHAEIYKSINNILLRKDVETVELLKDFEGTVNLSFDKEYFDIFKIVGTKLFSFTLQDDYQNDGIEIKRTDGTIICSNNKIVFDYYNFNNQKHNNLEKQNSENWLFSFYQKNESEKFTEIIQKLEERI